MAVSVGMRMRLDYSHLEDVADGVGWLADAYPYNLADYQVIHHRTEAPLGREFYTDEQGNEHPGWLRDSADSVPLPGPEGGYLVVVHADYAIYVNSGTQFIAPNPFWERATLRTEREADDLLLRMTHQMLARYLPTYMGNLR
jgi:hypothetical protein